MYAYTHIFFIHTLTHIRILNQQNMYYGNVKAQEDNRLYGVALVSRIVKIIGLLCKTAI